MQNRIKYLGIFLFLACFMVAFFIPKNLQAQSLNAPIITNAFETKESGKRELRVEGIVVVGTEVLIYVNGKHFGTADVRKENDLVSNFSLRKEIFESASYEVETVGRNPATQELSGISNKAFVDAQKPLPGAPTINSPKLNQSYDQNDFVVNGLISTGHRAQIFVDGVYAGETNVVEHESGVAGFFFKPSSINQGSHNLKVRAKNSNGETGNFSIEIPFVIKKEVKVIITSVIEPELIRTKIDNNSSYNRPKIIGQGLAGQIIQIYINNRLDGELLLDETKKGTVQFEYLPATTLSQGEHRIEAIAVDGKNKSKKSNFIKVNIKDLESGIISPEAVTDEDVEVMGFDEEYEEVVVGEETDTSDLEAILNKEFEDKEKTDTGIVSESKERLSKLRWNLFVFILFLVAVIAWIFWVNRELIKERQDENKENSDDDGLKKINEKELEKMDEKKRKKNDLDILDF